MAIMGIFTLLAVLVPLALDAAIIYLIVRWMRIRFAGLAERRQARLEERRRRMEARRARRFGRDSVPAQDVRVEPIEVPDEPTAQASQRARTTQRTTPKPGAPEAPEGYGTEPRPTSAGTTPAHATRSAAADAEAPYVHLDVDAGATDTQIADVLRTLEPLPVVGEFAERAAETLSAARHRRRTLLALVNGTFAEHSLSWDKFALPAEAGFDAIVRNAATMANHLQSFDPASYQRLRKRAAEEGAGLPQVHLERLSVYESTLASLREMQDTSDRLLLELEKLQFELGKVSDASESDSAQEIIDEIRTLVNDAKYYR